MTGHRLEQEEDVPLWEAVKAAGQYLDNISKHDLRTLSRTELLLMGSIIISTFAEERAGWFQNTDNELNDDIPF
jgi:hypothetical protein